MARNSVRRRTRPSRAARPDRGGVQQSLSDVLVKLGAVFAIDAAYAVPGEQWALNRGSGGQALRAMYGSVGRAEVRNGQLLLPSTGGNYAVLPDAPAYTVVDHVVRVRTCPDSWLQGTYQQLAGHGWSGAPLFSWFFGVEAAARRLMFIGSLDGTASQIGFSPVVAFTDGVEIDLMVTRVASTGTVTFFWKPSTTPLEATSGWTTLGTASVYPGAVLFNTTGNFTVAGNNGVAYPVVGGTRRMILSDASNGLTVLDIDFATCPDFAGSFPGAHGYGIKGGAFVQPGTTGAYLSVPDAAALDVAGDLELVCAARLVDYRPANYTYIWGKGYQSYEFRIEATNGNMVLEIADSLASGQARVYTFDNAYTVLTNGQPYWFKVTLDVDNGASGSTARLYYAPFTSINETPNWTLFFTKTLPNVVAITNSSNPVTAGTRSDGTLPMNGVFYRGIVRNGMSGNTVLDLTPVGVADNAQTFTALTGQTVTVNGCALPTVTITAANAVDIGDPVVAPHKGVNYVAFPGVVGNTLNIACPSVALSTRFRMTVKIRPRTMTAAYLGGIDFETTQLKMLADGRLQLVAYDSGAVDRGGVSTVAVPGLAPGVERWVYVDYDPTTGAIFFGWANDPSVDSGNVNIGQLGTTVSGGVNPTFTAQAIATVGSGNSSGYQVFDGDILGAQIDRNGSTLTRWRATDISASGITPVSGNTPTVVKPATGKKIAFVTRPAWLFGATSYMSIPHNPALNIGSEFDVLAIYRCWDPSNNMYIVAKGDFQANAFYVGGWQLRWAGAAGNSYRFLVTDGTTSLQAIDALAATPGELVCHVGGKYSTQTLRVVKGKRSEASYNGTAMPNFTLNTSPMTIGRQGTNLAYADIELFALAVFNKKLTDAEVGRVVDVFQAAA